MSVIINKFIRCRTSKEFSLLICSKDLWKKYSIWLVKNRDRAAFVAVCITNIFKIRWINNSRSPYYFCIKFRVKYKIQRECILLTLVWQINICYEWYILDVIMFDVKWFTQDQHWHRKCIEWVMITNKLHKLLNRTLRCTKQYWNGICCVCTIYQNT